MWRASWGPILLVLASSGCAAAASGMRQCPESRALSCLSRTACDYDAARGCEVCICEEPLVPSERDPMDDPP